MSACIVCGGALRTINEDGDVMCTVSWDHGYDDLVPPPVLIEATAECDQPRCVVCMAETSAARARGEA